MRYSADIEFFCIMGQLGTESWCIMGQLDIQLIIVLLNCSALLAIELITANTQVPSGTRQLVVGVLHPCNI